MTMRALVSADRPVVRIWHPDDPKVYVEIQFEMQAAANAAVEQLKYATAMSFGDERVDLFTLPGPAWRARTRSTASVCPLMTLRYRRGRSVRRAEAPVMRWRRECRTANRSRTRRGVLRLAVQRSHGRVSALSPGRDPQSQFMLVVHVIPHMTSAHARSGADNHPRDAD